MNAQPSAPRIALTATSIVWRGEAQGAETLGLNIANPDGFDADYTISVEGLEPGWYTVVAGLRVGPRRSLSTELRVQPPPRAAQGDYPFRVVVAVAGRPDLRAQANARLTLPSDARPGSQQQRSYSPLGPDVAMPAAPAPTTVPTLPPEVTLGPRATFRAGAGEAPAQGVITIVNRSRLLERYVVTVQGLPPEWFTLAMSELRLEPGASGQVPLRLSPQAGPESPAGEYPFRIRVAPFSFPDSFAEVGGTIALAGTASFDARLTPQQVEGRKVKFKLTLRNTGGLQLSLLLEASDMEGMCTFVHESPPTLEPGQEAVVPIWVGAHRNGLVGLSKRLDFRVRVAPAGSTASAARSFDARFVHAPFLSPRLSSMGLLAAVLAMIIGLAISVGGAGLTSAVDTVRCGVGDQEQDQRSGANVVLESCGGVPYAEQRGLRVVTSPTGATPTRTSGSPTPAATPTKPAQPTATPQPVVRKITVNKTLPSGNLVVTVKTVEVLPDGRLRFEMHVKNTGPDAGWLEDALGTSRPGGPYLQDSTGKKISPVEWGTPAGPRALGDQLPLARNAESDVYVIYPAIDATKPFALMDDVLFDNLVIPGTTSLQQQSGGLEVLASTPSQPEPPSSPDPGLSTTGASQPADSSSRAGSSGAGSSSSVGSPPSPPPPPPVQQQQPPPPPPVVEPPPPQPAVEPTSVPLTGVMGQLVQLINQYRNASGLSTLRVNAFLMSAAGGYASTLANQNFFSHYGLDGSTPEGRAAAAGYAGFMSGEVLSAGGDQNIANNVLTNWKNSPQHNAILLNPASVEIGVGMGSNPNATYKFYWIAVTGIP